MARTAHRTVIISAAFALASWALVVGAPVLAAAPAEQAGPSLPPAEYKPLPMGTRVTYDTWGYTVTKTEGFDIKFRTTAGNWKHYYAVFGKHGDSVYLSLNWGAGGDWESDLDAESKAALETIWPLKVGKKVKLNSEELMSGYSGFPTSRPWTVALEVVRAETLELNGLLYSTYVIEEHAVSEGVAGAYLAAGPEGYSETKWYDPESGLVLKSVKEMTRGPNKGDRTEYSLVRVRFPQGTKTNVLAGTRISGGGGADKQLTAEVARLKADAEAKQKALAEMRGRENEELRRQREEQKRLMEQVARLMREAEERRTAVKQAPAGQKGTVQQANLAKFSGINFGRYYALVIGNNKYKYLPQLKTAEIDARAVADVLRDTYDFKVTLLINATRADIVDALDDFREKLDDTTNLLIYYAGHGWLDEEVDRGYWLPVDAKTNRRSKWVSNATISDTLKGLRAKHVMVVADSCFSGSLVRGAKVELRSGDYWRRMARKRTRVALTSGGLEPVADAGGGRHSPFAAAFIDVLKANTSVMDGTKLFTQIRRPVMLGANQTPEYADVRNAGHDGGDFLFVRKR